MEFARFSEVLQAALQMGSGAMSGLETIAIYDKGAWEIAARIVIGESDVFFDREAYAVDFGPYVKLSKRAADQERTHLDNDAITHASRMFKCATAEQPEWHTYRMRGPVIMRVLEGAV